MSSESLKRPNLKIESDAISNSRRALDTAYEDYRGYDLTNVKPDLNYSSWTICPNTSRFLATLCLTLRPKLALEFGSGLSTKIINWACNASASTCSIISFEHDPRFAKVTKEALEQAQIPINVKIVVAPLVLRRFLGSWYPTYYPDQENLAFDHSADLIFIDGPPTGLGGRCGALFQAMTYSRPGSIVLLDDANRGSENDCLAVWRRTFGDAIEIIKLHGFQKGLAAIIVHERVIPEVVEKYHSDIVAKEISNTIPIASKLIIVDNGYWNSGAIASGRITTPFLEREGKYWGPPDTSTTARRELLKLRERGFEYFLIGWPAYWWFDCYSEFVGFIDSSFEKIFANERVTAWRLI